MEKAGGALLVPVPAPRLTTFIILLFIGVLGISFALCIPLTAAAAALQASWLLIGSVVVTLVFVDSRRGASFWHYYRTYYWDPKSLLLSDVQLSLLTSAPQQGSTVTQSSSSIRRLPRQAPNEDATFSSCTEPIIPSVPTNSNDDDERQQFDEDENLALSSPVFSNNILRDLDKEEDPLAFFREFLSQDKQRLQQEQKQRQRRQQQQPTQSLVWRDGSRKYRSRSSSSRSSSSSSSSSRKVGRKTKSPLSSSSSFHNLPPISIEASRAFEDSKQQQHQQGFVCTHPKPPTQRRSSTTNAILQESKKQDTRVVRFADQEGFDMETIFVIENNEGWKSNSFLDDHDDRKRVLILLLLPKQQVFEYVGLHYDKNNNNNNKTDPAEKCHGKENQQQRSGPALLIQNILHRLPSLASDALVAEECFVKLIRLVGTNNNGNTSSGSTSSTSRTRTTSGCTELINSFSIQSYNLKNDEVLVAVPEGYTSEGIMNSSKDILQNRKLMRALKRNKGWGSSFLGSTSSRVVDRSPEDDHWL